MTHIRTAAYIHLVNGRTITFDDPQIHEHPWGVHIEATDQEIFVPWSAILTMEVDH